MSKHYVIYIPGLGDNPATGQKLALRTWQLWGVKTQVVSMLWADRQPFNDKLARIASAIDAAHASGAIVSLVGASAGAGAALNAYAAHQSKIHSVTLICGQVLGGHTNVHPKVYRQNNAFYDSMQLLQTSLAGLNETARQRITSIHPIFDESVPVADTKLPGARWRQIPTTGHFMSIAYAITIGSRRIVRDIKGLKTTAS